MESRRFVYLHTFYELLNNAMLLLGEKGARKREIFTGIFYSSRESTLKIRVQIFVCDCSTPPQRGQVDFLQP